MQNISTGSLLVDLRRFKIQFLTNFRLFLRRLRILRYFSI